MYRSICSGVLAALLCSAPSYAMDHGQWKGELSRGKDGKIVVTPFPQAPTASCGGAPAEIRAIVAPIAIELGIDPRLVLAVIKAESDFNPVAVSNKAAQGLMQLIPATASRFGVKDVFNPHENIRGGMTYLRWLLDKFNGNVSLTLAGYNSGENAVVRYGGVPPYRETVSYVAKILSLLACTSEKA